MNIMHLLQRIFRLLPSLRMILGVSNCSRIHSVIISREMLITIRQKRTLKQQLLSVIQTLQK